jgi:hypothetical protein
VRFITSPDSTEARLFVMLRGNDSMQTKMVTYNIYKTDDAGAETYVKSIQQKVETSWMVSWQPVMFNSPGKYIVKAYRDPDHMITSKKIELLR